MSQPYTPTYYPIKVIAYTFFLLYSHSANDKCSGYAPRFLLHSFLKVWNLWIEHLHVRISLHCTCNTFIYVNTPASLYLYPSTVFQTPIQNYIMHLNNWFPMQNIYNHNPYRVVFNEKGKLVKTLSLTWLCFEKCNPKINKNANGTNYLLRTKKLVIKSLKCLLFWYGS